MILFLEFYFFSKIYKSSKIGSSYRRFPWVPYLITLFNPLMPNGAFNICCPRDCVSRHNGGTSGAPLKPLRVDSALILTPLSRLNKSTVLYVPNSSGHWHRRLEGTRVHVRQYNSDRGFKRRGFSVCIYIYT